MSIEVRIRTQDDLKSTFLCATDMTSDALTGVFVTLNEWGIRSDVTPDGGGRADLSGSFVLDETGAYFEVVVMRDGPST